MNAKELAKLIDKTGFLAIDEMRIPVTILDAKTVFNRTDVQVAPIGGGGSKWVTLEKVTISK